jgi:hypothetical protein
MGQRIVIALAAAATVAGLVYAAGAVDLVGVMLGGHRAPGAGMHGPPHGH